MHHNHSHTHQSTMHHINRSHTKSKKVQCVVNAAISQPYRTKYNASLTNSHSISKSNAFFVSECFATIYLSKYCLVFHPILLGHTLNLSYSNVDLL